MNEIQILREKLQNTQYRFRLFAHWLFDNQSGILNKLVVQLVLILVVECGRVDWVLCEMEPKVCTEYFLYGTLCIEWQRIEAGGGWGGGEGFNLPDLARGSRNLWRPLLREGGGRL